MSDLFLFRRHGSSCKVRKKGRKTKSCGCPIWCDGRENGKRVREPMGTRDWDRAQRLLAARINPPQGTASSAKTGDAIKMFLAECRTRHLAPSTVRSYGNTLAALEKFLDHEDILQAGEIALSHLAKFRQGRSGRERSKADEKPPTESKPPMAPSTMRKELELLRTFCGFCVANKWLAENPAKNIKPPREDATPATLPFEKAVVERIIAACAEIASDDPAMNTRIRERARALILTLLYSGLRISDVAKLERSSLDPESRRLLIRRIKKTRMPLYVRLSRTAVDSLLDLPRESQRYFFWSGASKLETVIGNMRRTVSRVLEIAGVKGHPHRFRDTFSVRLLEEGVPIRTVQLLLGHASVQTTERHYAPFVQSQQRMLDEATAKLDFGEASRRLEPHRVAKRKPKAILQSATN